MSASVLEGRPAASSQENPGERTPLDPVDDVTVATFSGMEVDPDGAVTVNPDYAGVEVSVPVGTTPQDRSGDGWGAWPQPLVDFHVQTGLSSYWYSSGGQRRPAQAAGPVRHRLQWRRARRGAAAGRSWARPRLSA